MDSVINGSGSYSDGLAALDMEPGEATGFPVEPDVPIQHLVIIDSAVEDISDLMIGVSSRQVLLLDSQENGVQQISEILSQYQNLQSVEIVSHCNAAVLQWGNTSLDSSTLMIHADDVRSWGDALTPGGDILIWGCPPGTEDVEGSEDVRATFAQQLSDLTGADVALYDDVTGSPKVGGDGRAENTVTIGLIEAESALNAGAIDPYPKEIETPVVLGNDSTMSGTLSPWRSNLIINKADSYTNITENVQLVRLDTFNFYAQKTAAPVTPFMVRVNGNNDFTVMAVGTGRTKGDYQLGHNTLGFDEGGDRIIELQPGETIAPGFLDAQSDGTHSGRGAVIPYDTDGTPARVWATGGRRGRAHSGAVTEGGAPELGNKVLSNASRSYHYNIGITILNDTPVLGAIVNPIVVEENTTAIIDIETADDISAESLAFSVRGVDSSLLAIDPDTGKLSFIAPPDYENPQDENRDNQYEIVVAVADTNGELESQMLFVDVANVELATPPPPLPTSVVLGNAATTGGSLDTWKSNLVVNETDTYTNTTEGVQRIRIDSFEFYALQNAAPVTPFVVKVNGDNDFTVISVGHGRQNYSIGYNSYDFVDDYPREVELAPGETIATGFLDATAFGFNSVQGAVIAYDTDDETDELWITGGIGGGGHSGSVVNGEAPRTGSQVLTDESRNYHYAINFTPLEVFTPEPVLPPTPPELVWNGGFGENWQSTWPNFYDITAPENRQVLTDPSGELDNILRVSFGEEEVGPNGGSQFRGTFEPMQSATLSYYVRFKDGFDPALGGKLPGVTGGLPDRQSENTGGNTADGTNGWSVRLGWRTYASDPSQVILRAYSYIPPGQQDPVQENAYLMDAWGNRNHTSTEWRWGVSTSFLDPENHQDALVIQTGEWYKVAIQVTLNTPGRKDGFIKGFIQQPGETDMRLAMHIPDLWFRDETSDLPIDRVYFSTFFGGKSQEHAPRRDEYIDFADFQLYSHDRPQF